MTYCQHCLEKMEWRAGECVCVNPNCTINTPPTTSGTTMKTEPTPETDAQQDDLIHADT